MRFQAKRVWPRPDAFYLNLFHHGSVIFELIDYNHVSRENSFIYQQVS